VLATCGPVCPECVLVREIPGSPKSIPDQILPFLTVLVGSKRWCFPFMLLLLCVFRPHTSTPVPEHSPVLAPNPENIPVSAPAHKQIPVSAPAHEHSPVLAPAYEPHPESTPAHEHSPVSPPAHEPAPELYVSGHSGWGKLLGQGHGGWFSQAPWTVSSLMCFIGLSNSPFPH